MNDQDLIKKVEQHFKIKGKLKNRCKGKNAIIKKALIHHFRDNLNYKFEYIGFLIKNHHSSVIACYLKPKNSFIVEQINFIKQLN